MQFTRILRAIAVIALVLIVIGVVALVGRYPECSSDQSATEYLVCQEDQNSFIMAGLTLAIAGGATALLLFAVAWAIELLAMVTENSAEMIESLEDLVESLGAERGGSERTPLSELVSADEDA